ncbi:cytosolic sulfotransferase 5-like [Nicotiana tomentosiformis]|uniref:cytosolic sulfotransferase 5-like n=1 Tax=Nicotiana tomentosiformis TaxID=4098 RepID=UPI00051C6CD9|nr:cytosolic sulfotransferase 5-like [Nicotiana tomentosiformis]
MVNNVELLHEYHPSLPKENWWRDNTVCQINGFWFLPKFVPSTFRVLNEFKPLNNDVILASFPKTGTTWLKSLLFSIIYRSSKESLVNHNPHELVPTLEVQVFGRTGPSPIAIDNIDSRRLFSTHIPYQLIGKTLDSSDCRVVYITRNPKDTLVSMWHFTNKWKNVEDGPWPIEEAIEKFCAGIFPGGPYYDHVTGFKAASLEKPENIFFITYEELFTDTNTHVKRLGEFLGCPFDKEEEVEEVVKSCSFDILSSHEVNKSEDFPSWFQVPYNSFFRQGVVGDHKNYLNAMTIERIDALTRDKFHGAGFIYGI